MVLKQAPSAWFDCLKDILLQIGFFFSSADPSLFICSSSLGTLLLLIYVDDMLLIGDTKEHLDWYVLQLGRVCHENS